MLPEHALNLLARVYRKSLEYCHSNLHTFSWFLFCMSSWCFSSQNKGRFKHPLSQLMAHRKTKRAAVAAAATSAAAAGKTKLFNIALDDGSAVLGERADTSSIRRDTDWRVKEAPACFKKFHDVICGEREGAVLFLRSSLFTCRTSYNAICCVIFD